LRVKQSINQLVEIKKNIKIPRIINVPKIGGFLPILPILTTLSALGSLASGSAAIAKTINNANMGKKQLEESKRHNKKKKVLRWVKVCFLNLTEKVMDYILIHLEEIQKLINFEFCSKVHFTFPWCVYERRTTKISLEGRVRNYKPR